MPADVRKVIGHQELKQQNLYRALAAECLGTLLLNFYGVISCVKTNSLKNDLVEVSLTFGLVVFAVVQVRLVAIDAYLNPLFLKAFRTGFRCLRHSNVRYLSSRVYLV